MYLFCINRYIFFLKFIKPMILISYLILHFLMWWKLIYQKVQIWPIKFWQYINYTLFNICCDLNEPHGIGMYTYFKKHDFPEFSCSSTLPRTKVICVGICPSLAYFSCHQFIITIYSDTNGKNWCTTFVVFALKVEIIVYIGDCGIHTALILYSFA